MHQQVISTQAGGVTVISEAPETGDDKFSPSALSQMKG